MFRLMLAALFAVALVGQVVAQEKADEPKAEVKKDAKADEGVMEVTTFWTAGWVRPAERVAAVLPVVILLLMTWVLMGIRSDINAIAEKIGKGG
jgi:hypothetical protein